MQALKVNFKKVFISLACIVFTALTLNSYAKLIKHLLSINYNWQFELLMVLGMLVFQYVFIYYKNLNVVLKYFFKLLLVSLLGSVLLWPLIIINACLAIKDIVNICYFFAVVQTMFFVHKNIVTKMQLPFYLSYTYILYRFIILIFII